MMTTTTTTMMTTIEMIKAEQVSEEVLVAMNLLAAAGFHSWLVGGCVRDLLLGRTPCDADLATDALPEETLRVFIGFRTVKIGLKHGTVAVLIGGVPIEITTCRVDGRYSDGRRPDEVHFTGKLQEDLARRDFTVNAMAWSPDEGLIDVFGGRADLERGVLRCVGKAQVRFQEDALRILRALRFAAVMGFEVEEETEAALFQTKELLEGISSERLWSEFQKLLLGKNAGAVVKKYVDVIGVFIPELLPMKGFCQNNPHHSYDVLAHSVRVMEQATLREDEQKEFEQKEVGRKEALEAEAYLRRMVCLKAAALFHDVGKPDTYFVDNEGIGHFYGHVSKSVELTDNILHRLKADNETKNRTVDLVKYHDLRLSTQKKMLKRWMGRLSPELLLDLLCLQKADAFAKQGSEDGKELYGEIKKAIGELLAEGECFTLKTLSVTGTDLMECGIVEGPRVGRLLKKALRAVTAGKVNNDKEAILSYLLGYSCKK